MSMNEIVIQIDDRAESMDAHGGKKISSLSISPNGKYAVTYSIDDNTIEGWIVENSELILDPEINVYRLSEEPERPIIIKVNDSKTVCYYYDWPVIEKIVIFQMSNYHRPLEYNQTIKYSRYNPIYMIYFEKNGNLAMFCPNKLLVYKVDKSNKLILDHEISNIKTRGVIDVDNNILWSISSEYLFEYKLSGSEIPVPKRYSLGFQIVRNHIDNFTIKGFVIKVKLVSGEKLNDNFLLVFNIPRDEEKQNIFLYNTIDTNKHVDVTEIFDKAGGFILYEYNSELNVAFGLVNGSVSRQKIDRNEFFNKVDNNNDTFDMENIRLLISKGERNMNMDFNNQEYKWRINKFKLSVYLNDEVICSKIMILRPINSISCKVLNNNALAMKDDQTLIIFEFDINSKSIKIKYIYFHHNKLNKEDFSGSTLPMMDPESVKELKRINGCIYTEWIKCFIKDDEWFMKYGETLLPILKNHTDPELIRRVYNKCTRLVKENPNRNLKFLKFISMKDLYDIYPDYFTKFNSEMFMFLNPSNKKINSKERSYHFSTFSQDSEILNNHYLRETNFYKNHITRAIQINIVGGKKYLILHQVNLLRLAKKGFTQIGTVKQLLDITASYPTYYFDLLPDDIFNLYKISLIFGVYHLIFELRKIFWYRKKYFLSILSCFDFIVYLYATYTSICWVMNGDIVDMPNWKPSVSCLLLCLKFILFLRIFEQFGRFFAIMFEVAKHVFFFLVILSMIIVSFANAFFLLLHPKVPGLVHDLVNYDDPNNPWTLSNAYAQLDINGNPLNETLIQIPDSNTNSFYGFPSSLFATYLFLTGNQNPLSPWGLSPENMTLHILTVVFSFLIVIYLMNLFIGILNKTIEKVNDKALYLTQKAKVMAEIELFYLLPHQRRWRHWFPEVIYYVVDVKKTRKYVKEAINKGNWENGDWPEMKNEILKLLDMEDAIK
ncbi:hypothetical protein RhiirB3_433960 [Rhizophagus irregularis]|nr:hypothetical protein RhiirB3_433960 [Rhizophagus irregularis]